MDSKRQIICTLVCFGLIVLTVMGEQVDGTADPVASSEDPVEEVAPLEAPPTKEIPDEGDEKGDDDDDDDDDDGAPEVPEGMKRENMVKWSAPNLNDEEAHSSRIPGNLKCDGCTAIAHQLSTILSMFHAHKFEKKGRVAPESDIIEIVENICSKKTFENYGLKSVNGVNRLSGAGTAFVDEPGMMQGGGRWPHRLYMMCGELVGELDEYVIYQFIKDEGPDKLFGLMCQNPESDALNSCGAHKGRDEL